MIGVGIGVSLSSRGGGGSGATVVRLPVAYNVPSQLTAFPAYVKPSALGFPLTQAQADSLRFYSDQAQTNELPREVVSADEIHVLVPTMQSGTVLYMTYDGKKPDYAVTDTYGAQAVWTNSYAAVWHMDQGDVVDSTANGINGTAVGNPQVITGGLGKALQFDGNNDGVNLGKPASLLFENNDSFSVSCWTYKTVNGYQRIYCADAGGGDDGYRIGIGPGGGFIYNLDDTAGGPGGVALYASAPDNTWVRTEETFDGTNFCAFLNGDKKASDQPTGWSPNYANVDALGLGYRPTGTRNYFKGGIAEVRVSTVSRSQDWITTEYNNQRDNAAFFGKATIV